MPDREKVLKGLAYCGSGCGYGCCPYWSDFAGMNCTNIMRKDALALLKEQEKQIDELEYKLAITEHNLNYYVNGNE